MTSANTDMLRLCLVDSTTNRWSNWSKVLLPKFDEVYVVSGENQIKKYKGGDESTLKENERNQLPTMTMLVAFIHSSDALGENNLWTNSKINAQYIFWFTSPGNPETRDLGERILRKTEVDKFEVTLSDIEGVIDYVTGRKSNNQKPAICFLRGPNNPDFDWEQFGDLEIKDKENRKEAVKQMVSTLKYLQENQDKFL